jgi:hypothetical protein
MNIYFCPLPFHCSDITLCLAINTLVFHCSLCWTSTLTHPQQPSTLTKTEVKTVSPEAGSHCFMHVIFLEWSYVLTSILGTLNVCWITEESGGGLEPSPNERHARWYVASLPFLLICYIPINKKFTFITCIVCNLWLFSSVECVGPHSLPELSFENSSIIGCFLPFNIQTHHFLNVFSRSIRGLLSSNNHVCSIWYSHSSDYEEYSLLCCNDM